MYTKPTIYLHIGAGKTGSTSIQVWLKEVESVLADSGYLVFDTNFEPSAQHSPLSNQQEYFHSIFLQGDVGIKSFQQQFRKNLHYMQEHGYHSAVMSAENLLNPWLQAHKLFDPFINDCTWKIIVYVRNQPEYLISAWKQWGYINHDFETYVSNHSLADWMSIITAWDTLFGKDAIYVGTLTASLLKNGFLTHDFANAIGVPQIALQHQADIQTNPSINFQTTLLLAKIRRQFLQNNPHFLTNHHAPTSPNKHEDKSDIQETILKNAQLNMLLSYKSMLTQHAAYTSLQKFNSTIAFVEQTSLDTIHAAYNASN
ncbi:MAG: hypothetical protein FJ040_07480 [Chloroflexi bacterium]|nr:hypothetical protein [Chloroflexota bacterium]